MKLSDLCFKDFGTFNGICRQNQQQGKPYPLRNLTVSLIIFGTLFLYSAHSAM